jgi:hypothetical protein
MSNNSYVPPHIRNKPITSEPMERKNPFQKDRRAPRRPHEKPFWQIEEEKAKLELEEKKKEAERGLEDTVENFPTLGNNAPSGSGSIWSGGRKFSELASEWKSTDDKIKEDEEREKNRTDDRHEDVFQLPRFRNMRRFSEPEDDYEEDQIMPEKEIPAEEKWTIVENRRYRKPKKEFDFSEDGFDDEEEEEDGTVWGASEEHETCWDERKH